jgi:hypothetical protein
MQGVAHRGYGLLAAHETGPFGRCIGPGLSGFPRSLAVLGNFWEHPPSRQLGG